ncbi:MAG: hydantoinase/oxoprolinase N-terminal domain-containing protein, partial [Anaerolineae bacterium]
MQHRPGRAIEPGLRRSSVRPPRETVLGVDVGGTFTDCVRLDDSGMTVHKRPSTPADPSLAVVAGVDVLDGAAEAS